MERLLGVLRPVVARWAIVLTGSPDKAEDVAQAVLLRIHRSIESYTPSGRFTAWAYRITRNVAADVARAEQREQDRVDRITREGTAAWLSHRPDTLELLTAVDELERFMTSLSPQQRSVLDLIEYAPEAEQFFPTRKFDEESPSMELIEDYNDGIFWEELAERLA